MNDLLDLSTAQTDIIIATVFMQSGEDYECSKLFDPENATVANTCLFDMINVVGVHHNLIIKQKHECFRPNTGHPPKKHNAAMPVNFSYVNPLSNRPD